MGTVSILPLNGLSAAFQATLRAAQQEAARLWNDLVKLHRKARETGQPWPERGELQQHTKGRYALHSQTVQMVCHQLLANVDVTQERRRQEPESRDWLKYPHKEKRFFPLYWPAQAVHHDAKAGRLILPMGRGRTSLVFRVALAFEPKGSNWSGRTATSYTWSARPQKAPFLRQAPQRRAWTWARSTKRPW